MIGAIIGDVVGSRFEFDNYKSKDFEMFDKECDFTDDSVMTLAIAKALQPYDTIADYGSFKTELVAVMHEVGMRYPRCGYGGRFCVWMMKNHTEPYNSYGNGSAMRVAPVGWFANSLEECEALAAATAEVTHNHPEGVKGAVAVAGAIYLARTGSTMNEIKEYIKQYYTVDFTLDEIREDYDFYEICQKSVPQALEAFFESSSFEDAIRNAISIGGDSDTIAAITGSVAEAFYGTDDNMKDTALSYLDDILYGLEIGVFLPLGNSKYVLTELYQDTTPEEATIVVNALLAAGWKPILAHTERYPALFDGEALKELIKLGAMIQVNLYSLEEENNEDMKERARYLVDNHLVHFVGSDSHRINHRSPKYEAGVQYLQTYCDNEYVEELCFKNANNLIL